MMSGTELDVLLVEDNPGDARLVEEMFQEASESLHRIDLDDATPERVTVHHEADLTTGIETLSATDVDVILLDLGLPESTGVETLVTMLEQTEFTPVVVLTGLDDRDLGIEAIQRGAEDYLVKDEVTGELLVHSIQYAIDRSRQDRERVRHRERLEALNRLNRITQDITHDVITTSTREDLERAVCARLVEADAYRFAWIGELDRPTETLTPRVDEGIDEEFLTALTGGDDADSMDGPEARTLESREVETVQDVAAHEAFEDWREQLRERDVRSVAVIPLAYRSVFYGVLAIYAESANAFTERERDILSRLGDVIGHAITAIERKDALVSGTLLQLEFRMDDLAEELVAYSADHDLSVTFDRLVRGEDDLLVYGRAEGVSAETFREVAQRTDEVEGLRLLATATEACEFELTTSALEGLVAAVGSHGGQVASATIADGEFRFVAEFPRGRDKRQLVELVEDHCSDATPTAQRTVQQADPGVADLRSTVSDQLTEKQRAALETAFHAGYFDWPRTSTGEDVAERLGVTSATFSQHLRAAEREFFQAVFEAERRAEEESVSPWSSLE
jgi:predicted DNA binding protein/DNA-binding NarL/FixJ family response regulator